MPPKGRPLKSRPAAQTPTPGEREAYLAGLGERLREQREAKGWTPADLGHRAGITGNAVGTIEAGESDPQAWTLKRLARALGCSAGWLTFGG